MRATLEAAGWDVAAEVSTAEDAIAATQQRRPAVVLLDVRLPGGALLACRAIAQDTPTSVVMLADAPDDDDLFASLRAGAAGFLVKDIAPARLHHTLSGVLHGEAALSREQVARLVAEFRRLPASTSAVDALTTRERAVLDGLAAGQSTAEVAAHLFIAQVTVRSHAASAMRKLRAGSRHEALQHFRRT